MLRCLDDYIRGKYIIYIFPRNVRHPAKSMAKSMLQNLPRQKQRTPRPQPTPSIKNPAPLRKRYHRGTQRAEGRGCGKDFPGSRAVVCVCVLACVQACACPQYPAHDRASLRLAFALCAWCAWLYPVTVRPLGYGLRVVDRAESGQDVGGLGGPWPDVAANVCGWA